MTEGITMVNVLKPVLAGVDTSADGAWAGAVAWGLAEREGTQCLLVHAVRDVIVPPGGVPGMADPTLVRNTLLRRARERVLERLRGNVPPACLDAVDVRVGPAARVLAETAAERDAGLIVLGGKRHHALGRWFGGSTAHRTVRLSEVPVLITTESAARVERILAAVDLSQAAAPTIAAAERYAGVFGARLLVMHAIEDVPFAVEYPALLDPVALERRVTRALEDSVWPLITSPETERVVRHGAPKPQIEAEVASWGAQLVVVGSHGRGWVDRVLLGSVAESLITSLPASLLVVPVPRG
jgi:nucleotide-binding universal stress UspA family protein